MKKCWSILFIASGSSGKIRRLPFNKRAVIFMCFFMLMGTLGLGRCIYFVSSYGLAKLGMYFNLKENNRLICKVNLFSKFAHKGAARIEKLISFEDKTRLKFGLEQISDDLRKVGVGGRPNNGGILFASLEDPVVMTVDTIKDNILTLLRQARLEDTTFGKMAVQIDKAVDTWKQHPTVSPVWGRITSNFGFRIHPFTGYNVFHEGIDVSNSLGTSVRCTADGITSFVGYRDYYGNVVEVTHPASGFKTVFAHLEKASVIEGQVIKRGELIGYLGNSGRSTGPHLHYEVHKLGALVNPVDCILPVDTMVD
jgi:hypothetical protein